MSKIISAGYTDTPISGVSSLDFPRGLVNFGADFRVLSSTPNEEILVNLTTPMDRPETFRFGYTPVADAYKKTSIDPSVYAPSRKGVSILNQLTEIYSVTDSEDASYRIDLPLSVHLVISTVANENVTPAMVQAAVGRLISGLFDTGSENVSRLQQLLRGSLTPSDL